MDIIDRWVAEGRYRDRSAAIQEALDALVEREKLNRLKLEFAKLDPLEEQRLAEENLGDVPWPVFSRSHTLL